MDVKAAFVYFRSGPDSDDPLHRFLDFSVSVEGFVIISRSFDHAATDKSVFVTPEHQALYSYWSDLPRQDDLPATADLDPLGFREALGAVVLVEPNDDASDFRYRLFGTRMVEILGRDLTGTWNSDHPIAPSEVFAKQYLAAITLRRCLYSENDAADEVSQTIRWCRLIMPMVGPDNASNRLVVGTVPMRRKIKEDA